MDQLKRAAQEAERLYGDIIDLPHPVSRKHPPLPMEAKAAQFSPFAALAGYEEAVARTERENSEQMEFNGVTREEI